MQRLPQAWFDHRASGDLMTRVLEDLNAMERLLIDGTEQGVVALVVLVGVTILLFLSNPLLAGVAMVPQPILLAVRCGIPSRRTSAIAINIYIGAYGAGLWV